ncbi:flagellar biosynthetic protein FliP [Helicobacter sp. 13S00401-1]|uniref:flagellar type III secretion system pore protein FliP n=1 Tax=Helicobacter sp. 13S00401-1 TaxID=1905758 RepID=UPI000BA65F85|nr:flagellar type III secretion system pore protein FliP [Helicobacter sp. 13S00401-1]PAF50090.1 flagellar biosynthetic protein FliP [Helicobacter sp. 13S00401-1]
MFFLGLSTAGFGADAAPRIVDPVLPTVNLSLTSPKTPTQLVTTLNIVLIITLLILAPSLVLMMTSFTRIVIVLAFLRTALGTQQSPPTQILVSLAMILTFFIMEPVVKDSYTTGIKPYMASQIGYEEAFSKSIKPFKKFMIENTRQSDLALFYRIRGITPPEVSALNTKEEVEKVVDKIDLSIALPAFMISELKTAFQIGFLIYLPFLVIDMVISSILMAMGMMMLPPVMISLPFKILIFVLVDGFNLLVWNLVKSFHYF